MHINRKAMWLSMTACVVSALCLISIISSKKNYQKSNAVDEDELDEEDLDWDDE